MAFDAHINFAVSTVAVIPSPAASGTSLTVASGEGARFPVAPFNATIGPIAAQPTIANAEIVRVTARVGDVFTIVRAQEGTTARTVVLGDLIAATVTAKSFTDLETNPAFNGVINGPAQPRTLVTSTSDQPTTSAAAIAVAFQNEVFDVGNSWTAGSPTALFVPTGAGGLYAILAQLGFAANVSGLRVAQFFVNGGFSGYQIALAPPNDVMTVQLNALLALNAGDYVQCVATQYSGVALNLLSGCRFGYVKLW